MPSCGCRKAQRQFASQVRECMNPEAMFELRHVLTYSLRLHTGLSAKSALRKPSKGGYTANVLWMLSPLIAVRASWRFFWAKSLVHATQVLDMKRLSLVCSDLCAATDVTFALCHFHINSIAESSITTGEYGIAVREPDALWGKRGLGHSTA